MDDRSIKFKITVKFDREAFDRLAQDYLEAAKNLPISDATKDALADGLASLYMDCTTFDVAPKA
jgi:hypothetical protein